ncbi:hypothetical protein KKE60_05735 [Patescibacteria group bacterium]|nr:hypothetical protein [Patescibacteria group bacterium]
MKHAITVLLIAALLLAAGCATTRTTAAGDTEVSEVDLHALVAVLSTIERSRDALLEAAEDKADTAFQQRLTLMNARILIVKGLIEELTNLAANGAANTMISFGGEATTIDIGASPDLVVNGGDVVVTGDTQLEGEFQQ